MHLTEIAFTLNPALMKSPHNIIPAIFASEQKQPEKEQQTKQSNWQEAWPFDRTISGVRLCWELEEPKGPKGLKQEWGGDLDGSGVAGADGRRTHDRDGRHRWRVWASNNREKIPGRGGHTVC